MWLKESGMPEIDVKQAVQLAKDFASDIFKPEKISRLGLEGVERTEDGKYWRITLGFSRPWSGKTKSKTAASPLDKILPRPEQQLDREYKVFSVDTSSGEVVAIKMFEE
jgi:hypothetical protein